MLLKITLKYIWILWICTEPNFWHFMNHQILLNVRKIQIAHFHMNPKSYLDKKLFILNVLSGCFSFVFPALTLPLPDAKLQILAPRIHHHVVSRAQAVQLHPCPEPSSWASTPPSSAPVVDPAPCPAATMLQIGDEVMYFSAVFLLLMLGTRSATGASLLTAFLYVFMVMFRFPPVPAEQAGRVLRPGAPPGGVPVVAHRGGSHDAPENTLAAIREVSQPGERGCARR